MDASHYDVDAEYLKHCKFIVKENDHMLWVKQGIVPGMKVPGKVLVGDQFSALLDAELHDFHNSKGTGSIPSIIQIANVSTLPGIVGASIGLPDIHSGYGFAVGHVAAFDMDNPEAVVSPGGVGYDINCGVRLLKTNLMKEDVENVKSELLDAMFSRIPVGVARGNPNLELEGKELQRILEEGMKWAVEKELAWPEDVFHVEDQGCMAGADHKQVSQKSVSRGKIQLGSLGSGNHYVELQVVDEIYDQTAANVMGIGKVGQVCVMLHCGSRGLGHQIADDSIKKFDEKLKAEGVQLVDRQLSCYKINSPEAKKYLSGMAAAANFAFVNRTIIAYNIREAFSYVFKKSPQELEMGVVYDVAHNIAKVEEHVVNGEKKRLLVHRKGSSRAFAPGNPHVPHDYQSIGQPVLIGGSMGTFSYVLTGTEKAMQETFGSTCHGAGRALGRNRAKKMLKPEEVITRLHEKGIDIRAGQMNAVVEEAPEAYKDVGEVVDVCERAGISRKVLRLVPLGVIKG